MTVTGLDSTLTDGVLAGLTSIRAMANMNGGAKAILEITNQNLSLISTAKDELRKTIVVTEDKYDGVIFTGELVSLTDTQHKITFEALEVTRKMLNIPCNTSGILWEGVINTTNNLSIHDWDKHTIGDWDGLPVIFTKGDYYQIIAHMKAITVLEEDGTTLVPDDTNNTIFVTTFNDPIRTRGEGDDQNAIAYELPQNSISFFARIEMDVDWMEKENTTIDSAKLIFSFRLKRLANYLVNYPTVEIYNYDTENWDEFETIDTDLSDKLSKHSKKDVFGFNQHPQITLKKEWLFEGKFSRSDFLKQSTTVETANGNGFELHRMRVRIQVGEADLGVTPVFSIDHVELTMKTSSGSPQVPNVAMGEIDFNTSDTKLTFVDKPVWDAIGDFPFSDGFCKGDTMKVLTGLAGDTLSGIITTNFTAIDNFFFDTIEGHFFTQDLTNTPIHEAIQQYANQLRGNWWIVTEAGNLNLYVKKKYVAADVILTASDIVEWDQQAWQHSIDTADERSQIRMIGIGDIATTLNISPEHVATLGEEVEIVTDVDVVSQRQASLTGDALKFKHQFGEEYIQITLDYTNAPQDYSGIDVGKTIGVKFPSVADPSIADYPNNGDQMLITAMEKEQSEDTAYNQYVTLTLERVKNLTFEQPFVYSFDGFDLTAENSNFASFAIVEQSLKRIELYTGEPDYWIEANRDDNWYDFSFFSSVELHWENADQAADIVEFGVAFGRDLNQHCIMKYSFTFAGKIEFQLFLVGGDDNSVRETELDPTSGAVRIEQTYEESTKAVTTKIVDLATGNTVATNFGTLVNTYAFSQGDWGMRSISEGIAERSIKFKNYTELRWT